MSSEIPRRFTIWTTLGGGLPLEVEGRKAGCLKWLPFYGAWVAAASGYLVEGKKRHRVRLGSDEFRLERDELWKDTDEREQLTGGESSHSRDSRSIERPKPPIDKTVPYPDWWDE